MKQPTITPQEIYTNKASETLKQATQLVEGMHQLLKDKAVLMVLEGDFGTGKTHFVKGVAKALGITEEVTSPSYTYIREYPFSVNKDNYKLQGKLIHIDAWRVGNIADFNLLGITEYLEPSNLIAVEWGSAFTENLLDSIGIEQIEIIHIKFEQLQTQENSRKLTVSSK